MVLGIYFLTSMSDATADLKDSEIASFSSIPEALMAHDVPRARRMLESFTDYLRSSLGGLRREQAALADELELARRYQGERAADKNLEDDVEAAGMDIDAGHNELVKVYGMTKGNRGLILKVFGILIFLIIFMKLY